MQSLFDTSQVMERLRNAGKMSLCTLIIGCIAGIGAPTARAQGSRTGRWDSAPLSDSRTNEPDGSALEANSPHTGSAARLTRRSRAKDYHDFLRIAWVPAGFQVTTLGKPTAKRVFFTASSFLEPAPTVDQLVNFVGNYYHAGQDLAVMVCRPTVEGRNKVAPLLATWPNLLPVIKQDLGDCSASTLATGEREICEVAERYRDRKYGIYAHGLRMTLDIASLLFRTTDSQNALWDDFGIATAFTGLGFAVWGSSTPTNTVRLSGADILRHSVVPEYVLKNATLRDANCHCVQVHDTEELRKTPVDPAAVWNLGELDPQGTCRQLYGADALSGPR